MPDVKLKTFNNVSLVDKLSVWIVCFKSVKMLTNFINVKCFSGLLYHPKLHICKSIFLVLTYNYFSKIDMASQHYLTLTTRRTRILTRFNGAKQAQATWAS